MSKQLGLFPEFDENSNLDDDFPLDYKIEIISLLELLLENGEVNLLDDDISDEHIESLIKFLKEGNE
jgi:hypothetical protein